MSNNLARPARTPRYRDLAQIHLGAKQLGLDRDTYEAMLFAIAGVRSAGDLDAGGRARVIAHLVARGAKLGFAGKARRNLSPIERKIRALWWACHKAGIVADPKESALRHWVGRQCNGIEDVGWLNAYQQQALVEALKAMLARAAATPKTSPRQAA